MLDIIKNEIKYINRYYFIIIFVSIFSIFLYGKYRCDNITKHKDVLEFSLFHKSEELGLDGWSITHYCLYVVFGYLYPNVLVVTISLGILWELFETYVGIYKPDVISGFGFCELSNNRYKVWWYGKWSDVVLNILGFLSGMTLHNYLN